MGLIDKLALETALNMGWQASPVNTLNATRIGPGSEQYILDNPMPEPVLKPKDDNVNHPKHYTSHPSGVECIEITEHYNFNVGNAIKYLWRQGIKLDEGRDPAEKQIEDCKKAIWYIERHIKGLKCEK